MIADVELFGCFASDRTTTIEAGQPCKFDLVLPSEIFRSSEPSATREPKRNERQRHDSQSHSKLLPRGTLVDKFLVESVLGTGGFAVVYRARHQLLNNTVALKLIKPDVLAARPGIGVLLVEEARFAARIHHPNVVKIYDVSHTEELTYIVMELIDGIALSQYVPLHGPLDAKVALRVGIDVSSGLASGLEQGLIHRDIKPANILLCKNGAACIVDFGLAHAIEQNAWLAAISPRAVVGTRGYMSPEQARGDARVDFRSDIYSLGVTLEEACCGIAFRHESDGRPSHPRARCLPEPFSKLLAWMQDPDPEKRPSSYQLLIEGLQAVNAELAG